jgi:hypothetical protein
MKKTWSIKISWHYPPFDRYLLPCNGSRQTYLEAGNNRYFYCRVPFRSLTQAGERLYSRMWNSFFFKSYLILLRIDNCVHCTASFLRWCQSNMLSLSTLFFSVQSFYRNISCVQKTLTWSDEGSTLSFDLGNPMLNSGWKAPDPFTRDLLYMRKCLHGTL